MQTCPAMRMSLVQSWILAGVQGKVDMILGLMDQTGRKVHPSFRGKLEAFLKHATVLQAATMGQPAGDLPGACW